MPIKELVELLQTLFNKYYFIEIDLKSKGIDSSITSITNTFTADYDRYFQREGGDKYY